MARTLKLAGRRQRSALTWIPLGNAGFDSWLWQTINLTENAYDSDCVCSQGPSGAETNIIKELSSYFRPVGRFQILRLHYEYGHSVVIIAWS